MNSVLVSGFQPFGEDSINPSEELLKSISGIKISKIELQTILLPVVFNESVEQLIKMIEKNNPDIILSFGQASGRSVLSLEKIGINIKDARIPDNKGNQPKGIKINQNGPAAYFTTLAVNETVKQLQREGIPAKMSYFAGTFVCNNLIYGTLDYLKDSSLNSKTKFGFVHIPYIPKQVAKQKKMLHLCP